MALAPDNGKHPEDIARASGAPATLQPNRPWSVLALAAALAAGAYVLYDAIVTPVDVPRPPAVSRGPILGLDDEATRVAAPSLTGSAGAATTGTIGLPPSATLPLPKPAGSTARGLRDTGP